MSLLRSIPMLVVAALLAAGCGGSTPTYDVAAGYTPASLARELVFRYKDLNPGRRNVRVAQPKRRKPDAAASKEAKAATKQAQATTLDDLIREVAEKAEAIPGASAAEALGRVADEVAEETSLDPADRKTIVDRLRAAAT